MKIENDPYFIKNQLSYFHNNLIHGNWIYETYIQYLRDGGITGENYPFEKFLKEWYNTKFNYPGEYHLYRSFIAINYDSLESPPYEKVDFEYYKNKLEKLSSSEYLEYESSESFKDIDEFWLKKKLKDDKSSLKWGIILFIGIFIFVAFYISQIDIESTLVNVFILILGVIIFGVMVDKVQNSKNKK